MIRIFQIDKDMAIIRWEGLEDMNLLAKIINSNHDDIKVKTVNREIEIE